MGRVSCRRPPLLPGANKPRGWCRFCGEQILPGERQRPDLARWHLPCVEEYLIATRARVMRRAVYKRDRGVCRGCGTRARCGRDWQADHVVPLYKAPREWWYWGLENVQTLCLDCHGAKCRQEAKERALDRASRPKRTRRRRTR